MNKLWQYNHYDENIGGVPSTEKYKQTHYFQPDSPGDDYSEVTDTLKISAYHESKYPERVKDGVAFVYAAHAKIASNKIDGISEHEMEEINSNISKTFRNTTLVLIHGLWKDALREISLLSPNPYVSQELIDEFKTPISLYVSQNY